MKNYRLKYFQGLHKIRRCIDSCITVHQTYVVRNMLVLVRQQFDKEKDIQHYSGYYKDFWHEFDELWEIFRIKKYELSQKKYSDDESN